MMQMILFFLAVTVLSVAAARRMAIVRRRNARVWMVAAALLGPLPLVPLVLL